MGLIVIDSIINDLKSKDSRVRNTAAIKLMDIGDPSAVVPLFEAILNPENVNHRGTLVYALGVFDCSAHLSILVDLVLSGNFEVSAGAIDIIDEIPLTEKQIIEIQKILVDYDRSKFEYDHNVKGFEELVDLVQ